MLFEVLDIKSRSKGHEISIQIKDEEITTTKTKNKEKSDKKRKKKSSTQKYDGEKMFFFNFVSPVSTHF